MPANYSNAIGNLGNARNLSPVSPFSSTNTESAPDRSKAGLQPATTLAGEAVQAIQETPDSNLPDSNLEDTTSEDDGAKTSPDNPQGLTEEELKQVEELEDRDAEVRAHEQAHARVGGQYAGSPKYEYETGPDNKRYAVGGSVSIDVSPEATPEETIRKMDIVKRAALAPAEPSGQDRRVAAEADQKKAEAQQELIQERQAKMIEGDAPQDTTPGPVPSDTDAANPTQEANDTSLSSLTEKIKEDAEQSEPADTGQSTSTTASFALLQQGLERYTAQNDYMVPVTRMSLSA